MVNIFWFRRDLRLHDNHALSLALSENIPVLPVFIFDTNITSTLPEDDSRISFIYNTLKTLNNTITKTGSSLLVLRGSPEDILKNLINSVSVKKVFINNDYEPYALERDKNIGTLLHEKGIELISVKDQVIYEKSEVVKENNDPYIVFTPYSKKWKKQLKEDHIQHYNVNTDNFVKETHKFPSLSDFEFTESTIIIPHFNLGKIQDYDKYRDFPAMNHTTDLGPHLRFGTISIREIVKTALNQNHTFLNELIWREFFMQILFHFPDVITNNFKPQYNNIRWINNPDDFKKWKAGETGYPFVDAGMRQLSTTGTMHNRARMIAAGFLCKHLLTDWRLGEAWFAHMLLDYEQSSNNGNWQWAAGTGCDAAPYFRIFNPVMQQKKFDGSLEYIRKWIPEYGTSAYPDPIIEHNFARNRAIEAYKAAINSR